MKQVIVNDISTWYYITEDGKLYNQKTNNWLKGQIRKNGYLSYWITLPSGDKKRIYGHSLVARSFIPNPNNKKQINHIDGNKLNNKAENLEWVTLEENQQHAIQTELCSFKHVFCFNANGMLVAEYKNAIEASKSTKVSLSIIQQELHKEIKTLSGGFYWSYDKVLDRIKNYKNLGKAKIVNQYDLNGKFINQYDSCGQAARSIGGNHSHIGECCRGKIKTYKGFIWRYAEDIVSPCGKP